MIKMTEYAKRRKALLQKIGANGIVIISSSSEISRNGDATYFFRQNSDFYYLTGFDEPDAVMVLAPKRKEGEYILFCRVRDASKEIWDGPRSGQEGARKDYLADESFPIEQLETMLPELLRGRETIHYPIGINQAFDKKLMQAFNAVRAKIRRGVNFPIGFMDVAQSLHEMRLFKSPAEIATLQKAIDITVTAHEKAMQVCKPDMFEYQLEAELLYQFNKSGSRSPAYNSIVGSGRNSCILHYVNNNKKIVDGDIVLIDAGAEYNNYAADITRTFPANGKFSKEQKAIYEIVLRAQQAAIKAIKPGMLWNIPQNIIIKTIIEGLLDLGILKGKLSTLLEKQAHFPFYMHGSGHWLGLDVHDVGIYKINDKWRTVKPGMVFTVEPGIYISADIPGVHSRWHNIGVRIEDNVLVTENGVRVLSEKLPKTIADIEAIMAN